MITLVELAEKLRHLDEVILLEVLEINSDDIVEMFYDKIEERYEELREEFEEESED